MITRDALKNLSGKTPQLRVYLVEWTDKESDSHTTLVVARNRKEAEDAFYRAHYPKIDDHHGWSMHNVKMKRGHMENLGMPDRFTEAELRAQYRRKVFLHHPDRGGTAQKMNELREAYDTLLKFATGVSGLKLDERTVEGKLISELGKGYPLSEAARSCDGCEGKGYRQYSDAVMCSGCYGAGRKREEACSRCRGTGRFQNQHGQDAGVCFKCKGKKAVRLRRPKVCTDCEGSGRVRLLGKFKIVCTDCRGIGEVKMWNPVIPRGLLAAK